MKKDITLTTIEILALRFPARKKNILTPVEPVAGEEWRKLFKYIHVSNLGRVKKLLTTKQGQTIEHLYKLQVYNGHLYAQYHEASLRKYQKVARSVLMAFSPLESYKGRFALFVDCNPLNCHVTNLRWASLQEIHTHYKENGKGKKKKTYLIPTVRPNGKAGYRRVSISPKKVAQIKEL